MQFIEIEDLLEAIEELKLSNKQHENLKSKAAQGMDVAPYTIHTLRAIRALPFVLGKIQEKVKITYLDLGEHLQCNPRTLAYTLGVIQNVCRRKKWPHITSIIVSKQTGMPGSGFSGCEHTRRTPREEREAVYAFGWQLEALVLEILDLPA